MTDVEMRTAVCDECGEPLYHYQNDLIGYRPRDCACKRRIREEEERREAEARERVRRDEAKRLCFGTKEKVMGFTFENFDCGNGNALDAKERCLRYAAGFDDMMKTGRGLFLCGPAGVGKTHLAAAICNALIDSRPGLIPFFTSFREVEQALIRGDADVGEKLKRRRLVVFDEFGAEFRNKLTEDKIKEAVNLRVNSGLPMIVTSNYTKERMSHPENEFEKYVFSRFYEACESLFICAEDFRMSLHNGMKEDAV